ncbi:UNVERIFIED_CONTAM: hypothetical protein RMT77_003887 [Armadillidium vulgare]
MESEKFQFHESGETIDKGWHGKVFETDFGKFLLFRLICQRETFRNFRLTREKKGTGKFDDFLFAFDSDDGKTKYSLIQLKHLSDESKKINFEDLILNSKSYFGLPYYFDYYFKSLNCLSNDKDLNEADFVDLIFYTNVGIEDSLGCISKREIQNKGLFQNSGKLYKLFLNENERKKLFHEQFLSERKRLANELTHYVMQNKVICLGSMSNSDSFSSIQKFSGMLLDHVIDVERNKFKNSFLDPELKNVNKELDNFRNEFFDSLSEYQKSFPHTGKSKSKGLRSFFLAEKKNTEEFIEFLREKTIHISTTSEQKTIKKLSEELVLSVMLQKPFNIELIIHCQKKIRKLIKLIKEEVIDLDTKKLRETFLSENYRNKTEVSNFRQCFIEDIMIFCENLKYKNSKEMEELLKLLNSPLKVQNFESSLKFILENGRNGITEILKDREILFERFPVDLETATELFPSGEVDATKIDENILKFLDLLTFAVNQNNFKNLLSNEMSELIIRNEDQEKLYTGINNFMNTWHNEEVFSFVPFKSRLNYRKWITEEKLLNEIKNLKILFQNREVKISEIFSCDNIITPEVFVYNFTPSAIVKLGKSIDKDSGSFYIHRTLVQRKKVKINSLIRFINSLTEQQSQDIFIFTIHDDFDMKDLDEFHSLSVNLKDLNLFDDKHSIYYTTQKFKSKFFMNFFTNNRKDISKRAVHWITFLGNDFKYESSLPESISNSKNIKEFLSNKSFNSSESVESEIFFIISGDPGSGKSVLLKQFSVHIKNLNVDRFWVILIPLNKYQKYLDKYDSFTNMKNVIDFLAEIENCENDFSRNVLKYFLLNRRLILLFDGFEEIHKSDMQKEILWLLNFLKEEKLIKQIWITSRPHCVHQIEDVLGCVAFEIKDISEDEQIKLVTDEWKIFHGNSQVNLIEKNASNFVKKFKDTISRNETDLLGVPLLTYMFSHAHINEAVKSSPVFPQDVSLVRLFENFILSKFNIFFTEKIITEPILQNDVKSIYQKKYQKFALRNSEIISHEYADIFSEAMGTELSEENTEMLKRIGLIHETNSVCTFIHETFAEYYIADLLLSISEKCMKKSVLQSVISILLNKENMFILYVFDTHVIEKSQGYKILESIMRSDEEFLTSLNKKSLSSLDILGRNCFYYALQHNRFPILFELINKDVDLVFEPFFVNSLKSFAKEYFNFRKKGEEIYLKLLEFILEKENESGYFAREILDQCFNLESEIFNKHWKIAAKLITKFGRKLNYPSSYLYEVLTAPEEFFDVYMMLLYKDKHPDWSVVLNTLIRFQTDRLKKFIVTHTEFILRIPVCRGLLDEKNSLKLLFGNTSNKYVWRKLGSLNQLYDISFFNSLLCDEETSSDFVNSVKMRIENFSLLFKYLFESKDVSFEEFNKTLYFKNERIDRSKFLPIFSDISLESLRSLDNNHFLPPWNVLYRTGLSDETLTIILNLLSKGDEEQVKRIYNICLTSKILKVASLFWEEAKTTELRKYYKI